ncbi:MAG: AAA family ATPase [Planctomycetota bacterium]
MDELEIPRLAEAGLSVALGDTPVVLVHGPRQCGKTTFARRVGRRLGHENFSFDDDAIRLAAQRDPAGFLARLPRPEAPA